MLQNSHDTNPLAQRRAQLLALLAKSATADGIHQTPWANLHLFRASGPTLSACAFYEPLLVIAAQGAKLVELGDRTYEYNEENSFVAALDVPATSRILRASPSKPYLCFALRLDLARYSNLLDQAPPIEDSEPAQALSTAPVTIDLLDAAVRLVTLLNEPASLPVLAPLIEQEILFRLLHSAHGPHLRRIALEGGAPHHVARAIQWIKANYHRPLRVDELAQRAHMSPSSLHHHFKALTSLSPVQFQKQLRLQEARRLMLAERLDASSASHRVGYESPSHFSRDYSRLFGNPPARDVARLRS